MVHIYPCSPTFIHVPYLKASAVRVTLFCSSCLVTSSMIELPSHRISIKFIAGFVETSSSYLNFWSCPFLLHSAFCMSIYHLLLPFCFEFLLSVFPFWQVAEFVMKIMLEMLSVSIDKCSFWLADDTRKMPWLIYLFMFHLGISSSTCRRIHVSSNIWILLK